MKRKIKFGSGLLFIPVAFVAAYGIAKLLAHAIPHLGHSVWVYGLMQLGITLLLLAIPFLILKAGFFAAHAKNRHEKEISLSDLPRPEHRAYRKGERRRIHERGREAPAS